ncbi:MAG: ATP-binding cassette domain-containing protein [Clostridia bacterium]|nr:ATP-binding cassette domain-containing protein [Clostridia bacterium]MBR2389101.1 ATP-binding cassette domain-containing protein [Clostridia bacterium]
MIKIDNLVKNYGSNCAVDDISFEVKKGEIVGFLGPNGAGKSTTMNILTGYLSMTSGNVEVAGINMLDNPLEAKKHIGYLPEQPPLYADMTVEEYLIFNYELKNCKLNRDKHLEEICEVTKIKDVYKRVIKNLSKGYRQRVGIAQTLIGSPEVIIFDEPTVGLDPKQIIEVRNLIRTLGKEHTVILSTHILQEVQAVCDRIIIINKGKIVADELTENITRAVENNRRFSVKICGPQKEVLAFLKARPGVTYAEVLAGRDGDAYSYMVESEVGVDIRKSLFFALAEKKWALIGLEALGMSLEDIFISVVDKTSPKSRYERRTRSVARKNSAENEIADQLVSEQKGTAAAKPKNNEETATEKLASLFDDSENK